MSKSLGNSPDPLDLIDSYGADAIRVGLMLIAPQGIDILFSEDKIEQGRNFMNKLWNSARFVLMNLEDELPPSFSEIDKSKLDQTDQWIISKLNRTIENVDKAYSRYRINEAIKLVYDFTWGDFCDWYIEFAKSRFYGNDEDDKIVAQSVSVFVLKTILELLHPYTPFITEEIWSFFKKEDESMLISTNWPKSDSNFINDAVEEELQTVMEVVSAIRMVRTNLNVAHGKKASLFVRGDEKLTAILKNHTDYLERLAKVEQLTVGTTFEKPENSATAVVRKMELFIPLEGLVDFDKEIERLQKQIEDMEGRLNAVNRKLGNENFVSRAPENVVTNEREKQSNYQENLEKLIENLKSLM